MSENEKTMRIVRDLDRKAIEGKLAEVRKTAQAANLAELASMFSGVDGMPRGQIETRVANALKWLADKPQHQSIIAPGHGYLIGEPHREVRRLVAHRLAREGKVIASLQKLGNASLDELLPLVYEDVPARVHRWAARSLTAHIDKLAAEGAVREAGGRFSLVESRTAG